MMNMTLFLFSFLAFLTSQTGGNPCEGMSVGDCDVDESQIVARHPYTKDLCHKLCKLDDQCQFWRHDSSNEGKVDACFFLATDYHQDCMSFASPVTGDLEACSDVDYESCDSILPEDCIYSGHRLSDFEPGPGHVGSIEECFEYGRLLQNFGVTHIAYLIETEDCRLYDSWDQECSAIGGPRQAPENCQSSTAAPTTTTTAAPTTTTTAALTTTTTAAPTTTTTAAPTTTTFTAAPTTTTTAAPIM